MPPSGINKPSNTRPATLPNTEPARPQTPPAATTGTTTPATVPTGTTPNPWTQPGGFAPPQVPGSTFRPGTPVGGTASAVPNGAVHSTGPITFEGPKLNAAALTSLHDLKMENYGTTNIKFRKADGTEGTFGVRDLLYSYGDGKIGARFVAVKDKTAPGAAQANKAMDDLIRREAGLQANDPIFALIAYVHPEEHDATLKEAATQLLKTEMGNTHLGAYVGAGNTTNSPENYHSRSWSVREGKPYPANVQLLSMEGVDQATLNKNLIAVDGVLNDGVQFPSDYKNDPFKTVDINTTLMFYRDWLKGESYLQDNEWNTYCAEHKTIVANVGLNVPQNEAAYKEIFGAEGPELWSKFKQRFEKVNHRPFTAADETKFDPLWKKEGMTAEQVRPPSKADYDKYQAARWNGDLEAGRYSGYQPQPMGKGMAWKPETTADLVKNFMETYAPFNQVGGFTSVASIMGFKDQVKERMGIEDDKFLAMAAPIMGKIMVAEGMARAPADASKFEEWQKQSTAGLYIAFGGKKEDLAQGGTVNQGLMGMAQKIMAGTTDAKSAILEKVNGTAESRNTKAYEWMRGAIQGDLEKARNVRTAKKELTEAYSPPAVTNRVINGLVEKSKFVNLRVIATAIDAADVQ